MRRITFIDRECVRVILSKFTVHVWRQSDWYMSGARDYNLSILVYITLAFYTHIPIVNGIE